MNMFNSDGTPTPGADKDTERPTASFWRETSQGRRAAVLRMLKEGGWVSTSQLCDPRVGGNEGTRRLREVREMVRAGAVRGWKDIEKRKREGSTQYEYRLIQAEGFAPWPPVVIDDRSVPRRKASLSEIGSVIASEVVRLTPEAARPATEVMRPQPEVKRLGSQELADLVLADPDALRLVLERKSWCPICDGEF